MRKSAFALAALAAIGFSGTAFAGEKIAGPAVMNDSELDQVTAAGQPTDPGFGANTALQAGADVSLTNSGLVNALGNLGGEWRNPGFQELGCGPLGGKCTAGLAPVP